MTVELIPSNNEDASYEEKSPVNKKNDTENYNKVVKHLKKAAKYHSEAAKYHAEGNYEKAVESTILAYKHSSLANDVQTKKNKSV